jgi:hypothetical protein
VIEPGYHRVWAHWGPYYERTVVDGRDLGAHAARLCVYLALVWL